MRTNFQKTMFVVVMLANFLIYCKKSGDFKTDAYNTERQWVHKNGGIYKEETLLMKCLDGSFKTATLNWSAVRTFKIDEVYYTEIPFSFTDRDPFQINGTSDNDVAFSFMIRTYDGKTEAAIKFTQHNVKLNNLDKGKRGSIEGYCTLDGIQINMWFTDESGRLMTMQKQNPANTIMIKTNSSKVKVASVPAGDCIYYNVPVYEYHCWITGGAYNDTACGWLVVGSSQYLICLNSGGGGGGSGGSNWPATPSSGGGGTSGGTTVPKPLGPCRGDVLSNPTIAPSSSKNKNGGRFGPTRIDPKTGNPKMHKGIDLSANPNTPIYAAYGGTVIRSISTYPSTYYAANSFGNLIEVQTILPDGTRINILYGHLNSTNISVGSIVQARQQIGLSGQTGNAQHVQYPHVHVQVRLGVGGQLVNPETYLATQFDSQGNSTGNPCF